MMEFTRDELERAHLIVVVDNLGFFKWSSKRPNPEAALMLRRIAEDIEQQEAPQ